MMPYLYKSLYLQEPNDPKTIKNKISIIVNRRGTTWYPIEDKLLLCDRFLAFRRRTIVYWVNIAVNISNKHPINHPNLLKT
jgi:hypothetical protein